MGPEKDKVYLIVEKIYGTEFTNKIFSTIFDKYDIQPLRLYEKYPSVFETIQNYKDLKISDDETIQKVMEQIDSYIVNKKIKKRKAIYSIIG